MKKSFGEGIGHWALGIRHWALGIGNPTNKPNKCQVPNAHLINANCQMPIA